MEYVKRLDEQQRLTDTHPHRETDPRVSTQLKHQVNVDKYAHNGQKRQERNLWWGEKKHMSDMHESDPWTPWGSGCCPPWRRPSCWSEAACRSEGCSSRRGAGRRRAAPAPTPGFQGCIWCGTWWDSWARTRFPLWGRGQTLTLRSVYLQWHYPTPGPSPRAHAYPAHRWKFWPRWRNAQSASSGAAGRPAGWSCRLWACWGGTPTPSGQTLLPRRSGSLSLRCLLAVRGLHPAGTCMTVTSGSEKHFLMLHKLSPIRSS